LITLLVSPGAQVVLGVDVTVERPSGRLIRTKGWYREAVRTSNLPVILGFGLHGIAMRFWVPIP
jgi:hypothetical protein